MASPLSFRHVTSGTLTVNTLINGPLKSTMLSDQFEKYAFVKRMESEPGFEEITTFTRRLSTPALLDVGRRTWIERTGKIAISAFCLDYSHTGYTDLVHGGILAALVDEGCADFCNRGAATLYPLTKYLGVEFGKPSPIGEVLIAKVSISQLFPLTVKDSREVWVKCEVSVLQGEDKVFQVVMANASSAKDFPIYQVAKKHAEVSRICSNMGEMNLRLALLWWVYREASGVSWFSL